MSNIQENLLLFTKKLHNRMSSVWRSLKASDLGDNSVGDGSKVLYDDLTWKTPGAGSETDPVYTASSWYNTTNNSSNWNTAYSWGNHASAGYALQSTTLTINGVTYDLSANRSWTISGSALADGDYGDITVSSTGTVFTVDNLAITNSKINDVAWSKITGAPSFLTSETDPVWLADKPSYLTSASASATYQPIGSYLTSANISDEAYSDATWDGVTTIAPSKNSVRDKINNIESSKQDTLVSGTNIKTVNGNDLLGSGNVVIGGNDSRIVQASGNITHAVTTTYNQIFTIPLKASTPHFLTARLIVSTNTAGAAIQVRVRADQAGTTGYSFFITPTTATAAPFDQIIISTNPGDTGETAILASANVPIPIMIECAFITGVTPGNLVIEVQPEVASTITVYQNSYYILSN